MTASQPPAQQQNHRLVPTGRWIVGLVASLLALAPATGVYGQGTVGFLGEEYAIRGDGTTDQPEAGVAANGRSFYVWTQSDEIYWRAFNASDTPLAAGAQLNTTDANDQHIPNLAVQPNGSFFAVWNSDEGTDYRLRGRFYDGAALEPTDKVISDLPTDNNNAKTAVAALTDGRFVAIWESLVSHGDDDSVMSIQGRLTSATGVPLGAQQFQVNSVTDSWQTNPDATHLSDGGFYAVWESWTSAGADNTSIQGRRFDGSGSPIGSDLQINTTEPNTQDEARVATNLEGEVLVVWRSPEVGDGGATFDFVRARWLNPDGTPNGTDFLVSTRNDVDHAEPDVAGTARGFVVTWNRVFDPMSGNTHDLDARVVIGPNDFSTTPFQVDGTVPTDGNQFDAAIGAYSDRVSLAWRGANTLAGHHLGTYGRRLEVCLFCDGFETGDTSQW